jgi:hypothetical protein
MTGDHQRHPIPAGDATVPTEEPSQLLASLVRHRATILLLLILLLGIGFLWGSTRFHGGSTSKVFELLGAVLVPAALVTFLFELFLRETLMREMRSELALSLRNELGVWRHAEKAGFVRAHEGFPLEYVRNGLETAATQIRILANWLPDPIQIEHALKTALQRGIPVQIVLLDPESPHAKARGRDLGYIDADAVPKEIRSSIAELARFVEEAPAMQNIDLRLHAQTPTHILFAWDNRLVCGIFLLGVHALQGSFLEFSVKHSGIGRDLVVHFDKLRSHAKQLSLRRLDAKD